MPNCLTLAMKSVSNGWPREIAGGLKCWHKIDATTVHQEDSTLENRQAMNRFLASVEKRAFRMAEIATGNREHALDIVQDAMLSLVRSYSDRPAAEWGPLFQRILQNRIRDWYRRSRVRNAVIGWLHAASDEKDGDQPDPVQKAEDRTRSGPEQSANDDKLMETTLTAVRKLPLRQQQTFLLRAWQGYDVAQNAAAMGISEGSVKTHYSRALHSLRQQLEAYRS